MVRHAPPSHDFVLHDFVNPLLTPLLVQVQREEIDKIMKNKIIKSEQEEPLSDSGRGAVPAWPMSPAGDVEPFQGS